MMKFPISSYEKLLNHFLPKEFTAIDFVEVKKTSHFLTLYVDIHLKNSESEGKIDSCYIFGNKIRPRIIELSKFFAENYLPVIVVHRNGRKVCEEIDLFIER